MAAVVQPLPPKKSHTKSPSLEEAFDNAFEQILRALSGVTDIFFCLRIDYRNVPYII